MANRTEEKTKVWAYDLSYSEDSDLTILDNVQFIYELSLAEIELAALGVDFDITNGLRKFKIKNKSEKLDQTLIKRTAYFKSVGERFTDYFHIIQKNRTRSVNQYLTHWIYPYKGKFHPQMIRALLNIINLRPGDTVFEPFSGSGTTALEAILLGINFKGIDISPLCVLQGKVKTGSSEVVDAIEDIKEDMVLKLKPTLFNVEDNYHNVIDAIENENVRDFYRMARLLAVSDNARRGRSIEQSFIKNLNLMIDSIRDFADIRKELDLDLGKVELEVGDSRNINLPDGSIDGIITSPPYSIALDYVENDAHSFSDLGLKISDMRDDFIGVRGKGKTKIDLYNEDMIQSYKEMYRVLKQGKFAVIVIGNATYQTNEVKTIEFTIEEMQKIGFSLAKNISKIIFGLYNVMKVEKILIFQK